MASDGTSLPPEAIASFQYQKQHINDDRRPLLLAVTWSLWVVDILALLLRFYAKRLVKVGFKAEDLWILLAFVSVTGTCIVITVGTFHGGGRHLILATPDDILQQSKDFYIFALIYGTAISAIKGSMLSFYYRTFEIERSFRIAVWCMTFIIGCWWIAATFGCIFACTPISFFWDKNQPGHCSDQVVARLCTSIINICTDTAIVLMPMPYVWKLRMPIARKLAVTGVFLLGGIVILASIQRLPNLHEINTYDFPYDTVSISLWTSAELSIGILGACLPLMTPLFRKVAQITTKKSSKDSNESGWPHARLEEGQKRFTKKVHPDDMLLVSHDEHPVEMHQTEPKTEANHMHAAAFQSSIPAKPT